MRRVGKSWLLLDRIQERIASGVPRSRILYCEFEDERHAGLRAHDLGALEEAFFARYPESRDEECWYFFDEIQEVEGWEKFVRRLLSDPRRRIALTGSSARLLGRELATNLRGRALATELLPFSFAEAVDHRGVAVPARWPTAGKHRSQLQHAFEQFLAVNPRKVYAVDHGLVRANTPSHFHDTGHHLENILYLELRRRGELAGYYLTRSKREVDFVATSAAGQRQLVQVCTTLDAEGTRERELRALDEAAEETGISDLTIVTLHEEGLERAGAREVRVVPAWRFLLEAES